MKVVAVLLPLESAEFQTDEALDIGHITESAVREQAFCSQISGEIATERDSPFSKLHAQCDANDVQCRPVRESRIRRYVFVRLG